MNFERNFCFDGENMPNSARYYTTAKSKLLDDVRFIRQNDWPKKNTNVVSHIKSRKAHTLFTPVLVSGCKMLEIKKRIDILIQN